MSTLVLLLLLLVAACRDRGTPAPVFIEDIEHAPLLGCVEHNADMPGTATELARAGDSAVVALFRDARTLLLLDDRLRVLRRAQLSRAGPHGVEDPVSVLPHADSVVIADAEGQKIGVFDWSGLRHRVIETDFAPMQLVEDAQGIAVAPAIIGRFPGTLLFRLVGDSVVRQEVGTVEYADLTVKALGNRVKLLPVRDGLIILHQFFTPRALHLSAGTQRDLAVPLATGLRKAVGYVPPLPLNDEALKPALVVANDAVGAENNELLLLARTGRIMGDRFEKAIVRTDSLLRFLSAHRLSISPGLMTYLPRTRTAVLVDEEDRWFTCRLP